MEDEQDDLFLFLKSNASMTRSVQYRLDTAHHLQSFVSVTHERANTLWQSQRNVYAADYIFRDGQYYHLATYLNFSNDTQKNGIHIANLSPNGYIQTLFPRWRGHTSVFHRHYYIGVLLRGNIDKQRSVYSLLQGSKMLVGVIGCVSSLMHKW